MKRLFPAPETWDDTGLVGISRAIEPAMVLAAYREGIFPWPSSEVGSANDPMIPWFSPDPRGVLEFKNLHVSASLAKLRRRNPFRLTVNQAFRQVIENAASVPRPGQEGTWITGDVMNAYEVLFRRGFVMSFEAWDEDALVGGIYGVLTEQYFSAESMFYRRPNASKICFCFLVEQLTSRGMTWMDTQMITDVTRAFGASEISRADFLRRI